MGGVLASLALVCARLDFDSDKVGSRLDRLWELDWCLGKRREERQLTGRLQGVVVPATSK